MDEPDIAKSLQAFERAIAEAGTADNAWRALHLLADDLVGARLFTVTTVDMTRQEARRLYTSDPVNYPVSGAKPILIDPWHELVVVRRQDFIANTLREIAEHFPDHELIGSLGLGSALNVPVALHGEVVATINCLDAEHHFTAGRVEAAHRLVLPATLCLLLEAGEP